MQRGLQEENKGIEMRHFCPPELDFLWQTLRRVGESGNCTCSRSMAGFQVGHNIFPTWNQPWGEKALVSETTVPSQTSWGGECYLLLGFTNLPVELREMDLLCWWSYHAAEAEQRSECWLIAALNCSCKPATAPDWQHLCMKPENAAFFSA